MKNRISLVNLCKGGEDEDTYGTSAWTKKKKQNKLYTEDPDHEIP